MDPRHRLSARPDFAAQVPEELPVDVADHAARAAKDDAGSDDDASHAQLRGHDGRGLPVSDESSHEVVLAAVGGVLVVDLFDAVLVVADAGDLNVDLGSTFFGRDFDGFDASFGGF